MTLVRHDVIWCIISIISICISPCHAAIPNIAIYGMVAGGALILVVMALLIALLVKRCHCRRNDNDDVEKGQKKTKDTKSTKTKTTKLAEPKTKPKGKKGFLAVKPAKKSTKNGEKANTEKKGATTGSKAGNKHDQISAKEQKKQEKLKKKQMKKEAKEKKKLEKEKEKQAKAKKNDTKNGKNGNKNGKNGDKNDESKGKDKWKGAVSKIGSLRNGNNVSPTKSPTKAKIAWTKTVDAAKKQTGRWN